jgi:hypothetical protein
MRPVEYEAASLAQVQIFNDMDDDAKNGAYWSRDEIDAVRKQIKVHYIAEQQCRCCYCNQELPTQNNAVWDAEHIISRSYRPAFMFEPRNLAVSCKDCNIAKSESNVLKNKNRKTFPKNSTDYLIVHPHFDEYDEHIRWFGKVCSSNGSDKGAATIAMCNLLRFSAKRIGMGSNASDRRFDALVGSLIESRSKVDAEAVLAALAVYAAQLP